MSREPLSPYAFLQKCDWEGGSILSGFKYGLRAAHLDDSNPEFNKIIKELEYLYEDYKEECEELVKKALDVVEYEFE